MTDNTRLGEVWTRYWASGRGESFAAEAGGFDSGPFWRAYFATFPDEAKLLDLATGGGHVVRFALSTAAERRLGYEIHGVDLANLAPVRHALGPTRQSTLRLHGNTDLAALPFADGVFDGVASQFGIEYADRDAAVREAVRVLKPGGRGLFLMHHACGAIAKNAAARLKAHRYVIADDAAFRHGERLFALYARGSPRVMAMGEASAFRAAVQAIMGRFSPDPLLSNTAEIVSFLADTARTAEQVDPRDALKRLKFAEDEVTAWVMRQGALVASALDEKDIRALARTLEEAGAEVRVPEAFRNAPGTLLAWSLAFEKWDRPTQ